MVRNILLRLDEQMFNKLKKDKAKTEALCNTIVSWEHYIKLLFKESFNGTVL